MAIKLRSMLFCLFWCLGFAAEVTVEKVVTYPSEIKTSVVIFYEGTPKLKFFALDSADGVFTLDLPGVFSKFDFSTLSFDQVQSVQQAPIDPEKNEGLSIRFFLTEGADYHVFDNKPGALTLFFEDAQPSAEKLKNALNPPSFKPMLPDPLSGDMLTLAGKPGERRFSHLAFDGADGQGFVYLKIDSLENYRTFSLSNPSRFVLDLDGTILSLPENNLVTDAPPVKQIRVRQFQSHPVPITRLVLDLVSDAQVRVLPSDNGLTMAYGPDSESLSQLVQMAQSGPVAPETLPSVHAEPQLLEQDAIAQAASLGAEETVEVEEVTPEPVDLPLETTAANSESRASETPSEDQAAYSEADPSTLDQPLEMTAEVIEVPEPVAPSVLEQDASLETSREDPVDQHGEEKISEVDGPLIASATPGPVVAGGDVSTPAHQENTSIPEPTLETEVVKTEVPAELQPEAAVAQPTETLEPLTDETENAVADTAPQQLEPAFEEMEALAASEPGLEAEPISAETPSMEAEAVDPPMEDLFEESRRISDQEVIEKPQFEVNTDADQEMEEFLTESDNKTFFNMMKGVKSNRARQDKVVVTNASIQKSKRLSEASLMQEPEEDPDQIGDLFRDAEADSFETISEPQKEYRGFEIAIIDIRDQPVLDLLRFIADQVGINLFVDSSVGDIRATYRFRNMPWDQVLDIILTNANLDKEFRNGVLRIATVEKFRQEEIARLELREQRELSVPTETVYRPLNYAKAIDVLPIISEYLSPRGTILMDERTNTLIIEDIPNKIVEIRTLINRLDTMIAQVTIEARIVETTTRFLRELGIQWGLTAQYSPELGTDTGVRFPNRASLGGPVIGLPAGVAGPAGGYAVNFPVVAENPSGFGLTLGNFLDNFKLDISLQLLESEGHGQIISSPKITTQNNQVALIRNGQRIPIQTIQRGTVTTRFVDAVLELEVTPHITADETIIMDVVVDKSEPDFTRAAGVGGNPIINVSRAETQVLVKNGGTAVIGGIFSLNETNSLSGIPKLRTIPILKRLFGNERKEYSNQELLIFVTPKIVKY